MQLKAVFVREAVAELQSLWNSHGCLLCALSRFRKECITYRVTLPTLSLVQHWFPLRGPCLPKWRWPAGSDSLSTWENAKGRKLFWSFVILAPALPLAAAVATWKGDGQLSPVGCKALKGGGAAGGEKGMEKRTSLLWFFFLAVMLFPSMWSFSGSNVFFFLRVNRIAVPFPYVGGQVPF